MSIYNEIDALNWSTLKLIEISPAYAKNAYDHPEEIIYKPAFLTGRVVHTAILEPDEFNIRYIVQPDFGDMRTKKAKLSKAEWLEDIDTDSEIITANDSDMAWRCAEAISKNEHAMRLLDGAKFENIVTWGDSGVKCKGRVDAQSARITDLKTTRRNTLEEVLRDAATFNYHAQLAWYHDGAVRAGLIDGKVLPATIFIHGSHKSNFIDIVVLEMIGSTYESGRAKYKKLLSQYIACNATNWWPGMAERPVFWTLPEWKINQDMDEGE